MRRRSSVFIFINWSVYTLKRLEHGVSVRHFGLEVTLRFRVRV